MNKKYKNFKNNDVAPNFIFFKKRKNGRLSIFHTPTHSEGLRCLLFESNGQLSLPLPLTEAEKINRRVVGSPSLSLSFSLSLSLPPIPT